MELSASLSSSSAFGDLCYSGHRALCQGPRLDVMKSEMHVICPHLFDPSSHDDSRNAWVKRSDSTYSKHRLFRLRQFKQAICVLLIFEESSS